MASVCHPHQHCCHAACATVPFQETIRRRWRCQSSRPFKSSSFLQHIILQSRDHGQPTQRQLTMAVMEESLLQADSTKMIDVELGAEHQELNLIRAFSARRGKGGKECLSENLENSIEDRRLGLEASKGDDLQGLRKLQVKESNDRNRHLAQVEIENAFLTNCRNQTDSSTGVRSSEVLSVLEKFGFASSDLVDLIRKQPRILAGDPNVMHGLLELSVQQGLDTTTLVSVCKLYPNVLFQSVDHVKDVIHYFDSIGVYREEFLKIIKLRPQLLGHQVARIMFVVNILLDYGVPVEHLTRLIRKAPELFSDLNYSCMATNLEYLASMGVVDGVLGKALARRPNLLNYDVDGMRNAARYLETFIEPRTIPKLIRRYAEVLVLDPTRKMRPVITYFAQLGVSPKDIGKIILRRPQLLGFTIPSLRRSVECLQEFGVKENMVKKVITTAPQILTMNVEERLRPAVDFFRTMGLTKERDIEMILIRNGQILCCSVEKNLRPKFEFFLSLGLKTEDIARMIVLFPSMLGQSIEGSLAPKYDYLANQMKRPVHEVIDFPQYFGYSLEKRITPRHEKLSKRGLRPSLPSMLVCVERDFQMRYMVGKPATRAPYKTRRKVLTE